MLLATLILASHCASDLCPTVRELEQAIRNQRATAEWDIMTTADRADPATITLTTPRRITRMSDIFCGEPYPGTPASITCKATLHFGRNREHLIVKLTRQDAIWRVEDQLAVVQPARR